MHCCIRWFLGQLPKVQLKVQAGTDEVAFGVILLL